MKTNSIVADFVLHIVDFILRWRRSAMGSAHHCHISREVIKKRIRNGLIMAALFIVASTLRAQVPQIINYQGRVLVGPTNFNGAGQFKFALVNSTGTTTYWSNDGSSANGSEPTNAVSLTVSNGLYSVLLGDTAITNMTPIPTTVFNNSEVRLRVWFNNGTIGSQLLSPDQRIVSVGYAVIAGNVPDGAITTAKIASGAVGSGQIANGGVGNAQIANGAVNSAKIDNTSVQQRVTGTAPSGSFITGVNANGTVTAAAGGSGTITGVAASTGLTGGGSSGNVTLSIANGGVTGLQIANGAVGSSQLLDGSIAAVDIAAGQVAKTINGLTDSVTFAPGSNVSITPSGNTLTIASSGGAFSLNGTSAYYNGGNVGIGTSSPASALDVRGNLVLEAGGSPGIFTSALSGEQNRYLSIANSPATPTASGLKAGGILVSDDYFYANPGKNDLIVKGKIGIGTASPSPNSSVTISGGGYGLEQVNGTVSLATFVDSEAGWLGTRSDDPLNFFVGGGPARMTVTQNGRVGIGTTTPFSQFQVNAQADAQYAIAGEHSSNGYGVFGQSVEGIGVLALAIGSSGTALWGSHQASTGITPGINGRTYSVDAGAIAILGEVMPVTAGASSAAVRGNNHATGSGGVGVVGVHDGSGFGVYGQTTTGGYGVYGSSPNTGLYGIGGIGVHGVTTSGNGVWAGLFDGDVGVTGDLVVNGSKNFKIDHPLDPANKYLVHSCIESPDRMNIYNGNVTTGGDGEAVVELPGYFSALNSDFRYQLTVLGQFAQAIIAAEIENNRFTIKTDKPNVKVSWQVTGVRRDAYARAHPMVVEQDKASADKGLYLKPELFNQPPEKKIGPIPPNEQEKE